MQILEKKSFKNFEKKHIRIRGTASNLDLHDMPDRMTFQEK